MISTILSLLSAAVTIFTILCFVDIILSWFPGAKFTAFGKFISSVCDPYLNLFSRSGLLRFGNVDFSPLISIGILSVISSVLGGIIGTGRIYVGGILATIIYMLWNVCSSIISIIFLVVLVRWIVLLVKHGQTSYDSGWYNFDQFLQKITYKVARTFVKNNVTYQKSLLLTWISFAVILTAGKIFIGILVNLCYSMPF